MQEMASFAREDPFPSYFANAVAKALGLICFGFTLVKQSNTTVRVPASADEGAAIIGVEGKWRWVEANVTVAHPGGAAGVYPIFATAADNNVVNTPDPFTDDTDYSFSLVITAPGGTPAGVDLYRQVGVAQWDGAKITRVDQTVPALAPHKFTHITGGADAITPADIGALGATAAAGGALAGNYPNPTADATWQNYTPHVHSADGLAVDGSGSVKKGRYKQLGGYCLFLIDYLVGSGFSGGTGEVWFDLPPEVADDITQSTHAWLQDGHGRWWEGDGHIYDGGATVVHPMFPTSDTASDVAHLQNAALGSPSFGSSVPAQAGSVFALQAGSRVVISGFYKTAP